MATENRKIEDSLVKVSVFKTIYTEIKNALDNIRDQIHNNKITLSTTDGEKGHFTINQNSDSNIDISPSYNDIVQGLGFVPSNSEGSVLEGTQTGFIDLEGASVTDINQAVAEVSNMKLEVDTTNATTIISI